MAGKLQSVVRRSSFKVFNQNPIINKWYDDLQNDYRKFFEIFYPLMGIGYGTVEKDDGINYVEPKTMPEGVIGTWLKCFIQDTAADRSSSYSFFYEGFKNGPAKKTKYVSKFVAAIPTASEEELLVDDRLTPDQWRAISQQVQDKGFDSVWREKLALLLVDPNRTAGVAMRSEVKEKCLHPNDKNYCAILTEMLGRSLRSQYEKYHYHINETTEIQTYTDRYRKPEAELLLKFCSIIHAECGVSEKVLTKLFKSRVTKSQEPLLTTAIELRDSQEFAELSFIDPQQVIGPLYKYVKGTMKLARRKKYPLKPSAQADFGVPIGLTALGNFNISTDKRNVNFDFDFLKTKLETKGSHYFYGLEVTKSDNSFLIKFRHKVKTPKKHVVGDEFNGVVKQIQLLRRKNGHMSIGMSYTMTFPGDNDQLAWFYRKADNQNVDLSKLPDSFMAGAIDLNLIKPVCGCKAKIFKGLTTGSIQSFQYGSGELVSPPRIILDSSDDLKCINTLKYNCWMTRKAIRFHKLNKFKSVPIPEDVMLFLEGVPGITEKSLLYCNAHDKTPRKTFFLINLWVSYIKNEYRKIKFRMRADGHKNVADNIQLIDLIDKESSLSASFERIHLKPGEFLPNKKKFDTSRANFKKYVVRTLAAAVVQEYKDCNIVFIEDLDGKTDRDNDNNSLTRLFSAKMLIDEITRGLKNVGVEDVIVDKRGTSRGDPVTGLSGYRDKTQKERLYVRRNNEIGYIHADKAASLNVLLCGLNHSVYPYKFFIAKEQEELVEQSQEAGNRNQKFFSVRFQTKKPKLAIVNNEITHDESVKKKDKLTGYFYTQQGQVITQQENYDNIKTLKDEVEKLLPNKEFSVTAAPNETYKNYRF